MAYKLEMRHFGKVPEGNVRTYVKEGYVILAARRGAPEREGALPIKTADETVRSPRLGLIVDSGINSLAQRVVQERLFTPEYLLNITRVQFNGYVVDIYANKVNYGSLSALQVITSQFPEDKIRPVLDQVAPGSARGVLVSAKNEVIYLARRKNVNVASGRIDTYPAGGTGEDESDINYTLRAEAMEEAGFRIGQDGEAFLIGLTRGRNEGISPSFNYMIETDWSIDTLRRNTTPEHDKVYETPLDEKKLRERIVEDLVVPSQGRREYERITEHGLSALLQVGKVLFGNGWYKSVVGNLLDRYEDISITESNIFK